MCKLLSFKAIRLVCLLSIVMFAGAAFASGGYGGGSYSGSNTRTPAQIKADKLYKKGKSVMRKKLRCSGCSLSQVKIKRSNAAAVADKLIKKEYGTNLNDEERQAAVIYLIRRYKIPVQ